MLFVWVTCSGCGAPGTSNQSERSPFPSQANPSSGTSATLQPCCRFKVMPRSFCSNVSSCVSQLDLLVRWPPPLHSQQRGHGDGVVSAGPAAHEAAHVLLIPEQLRCRLTCLMFTTVQFSAGGATTHPQTPHPPPPHLGGGHVSMASPKPP